MSDIVKIIIDHYKEKRRYKKLFKKTKHLSFFTLQSLAQSGLLTPREFHYLCTGVISYDYSDSITIEA